MKTYMGHDQYGNTYHDLGPHPRKRLLEILYKTKAKKMYCDYKDGKSYHVGYIIGGYWIDLYEVIPFKREA